MDAREACAAKLESLYAEERTIRLEFLTYLEEFDRRSWYAPLAKSSTWAFLTERLRMSNGKAFRRIRAARLLGRLPVVRSYLEAGRISLTKLAMLDDVLEESNCVELIELAIEKSEQDVRIMVAELRPASTSAAEVRATNLTSELTEVKMIVNRDWMATLEHVSYVISHEVPRGQIPDVLLTCMKKVIAAHQRRTAGATKPRPRKSKGTRPSAAVRRAVWERDEGRCTFTAPDGTRCNSRHQLQEHHIVPVARRGPATIENITLHCRVHNLERAREDFGEQHMAQFKRDEDK